MPAALKRPKLRRPPAQSKPTQPAIQVYRCHVPGCKRAGDFFKTEDALAAHSRAAHAPAPVGVQQQQQQRKNNNTPPRGGVQPRRPQDRSSGKMPLQQQPMQQQHPPQQQMRHMVNQLGNLFSGMMVGDVQQKQQQPMSHNASQTWQDFAFVQLNGPVRRATYGPAGSQNDVTAAVNGLVQQGRLQIHGGIHTAIGDPFPGVPKQFQVWY